ncbi:hypothetical protein FisN_29Hh070 [Fistulifera solaris]|jgi:hypothetical protein|uniref:Uncharacterized protein n=1 Tax=Fistulifera solaris TaxID=1519565 RepID=A0A1Z5K5S1_FISSO|nr:hypothetical protein FisN_29Hh070 [Fistulifera solaris]|eukprot:GAX21633.1 hypothetical protein FisN_29Hh070 [Fistulifera solaris]
MNRRTTIAALLFLACWKHSESSFLFSQRLFAPTSVVSRQSSSTCRTSKDDENDFDVETARQNLDKLIKKGEEPKKKKEGKEYSVSRLISPYYEITLPPPPPMTAMERDRRLAEIKIIQRLTDEDATDDLWELWFNERGATARDGLKQADQLMSDPNTWKQCEMVLLNLLHKHGVYFVEPVNRLATLYYLQGRYDQSFKLCQVVLELKPWHFGALSGIVAVCIGKGDREAARFWADRRLPNMVAASSFPPFSDTGAVNPRRKEWVERAVHDAAEALLAAEMRTAKSFGAPEDYYSKSESNTESSKDDMPDEWQ